MVVARLRCEREINFLQMITDGKSRVLLDFTSHAVTAFSRFGKKLMIIGEGQFTFENLDDN